LKATHPLADQVVYVPEEHPVFRNESSCMIAPKELPEEAEAIE
jgi:hypothetical protein